MVLLQEQHAQETLKPLNPNRTVKGTPKGTRHGTLKIELKSLPGSLSGGPISVAGTLRLGESCLGVLQLEKMRLLP